MAQVEGNGGDDQGADCPAYPDLPHAGILHECQPGLRTPGVLADAGGLCGGGGQNAQQPDQEDQAEPGQRALQAGDPGGVVGPGDCQKDAAADQDHVGREL